MTRCKHSFLIFQFLVLVALTFSFVGQYSWGTSESGVILQQDISYYNDLYTSEPVINPGNHDHRHHDFLIPDVKVDITSTSAQLARNEAILQAQQQAVKILFSKIVPHADDKILTSIQDHDLEFMVQDFEITHEKISSIRYIATFTIRFNPVAVRQFLKKHDQQYASYGHQISVSQINTSDNHRADEHRIIKNWLVIPVLKQESTLLLWEENNDWYQQWNSYDFAKNSPLKLTLPIGDLPDLNTLQAGDIFDGHIDKLDTLLSRYNINDAVIAVLDIAHDSAKLSLHQYQVKGSRLAINTAVLDTKNLSEPQIYSEAINETLIQLDRKHEASVKANLPKKVTKILIDCQFVNFADWLVIKRMFESTPGIQLIVTKSLKKDRAQLQIAFNDDLQKLNQHLLERGFEIKKIGTVIYKLSRLASHAALNFNTHVDPNDLPPPIRHRHMPRVRPYYVPSEIEN